MVLKIAFFKRHGLTAVMYRCFETVKIPEYFGDRGTIVDSAALILFIFVRVSIHFY